MLNTNTSPQNPTYDRQQFVRTNPVLDPASFCLEASRSSSNLRPSTWVVCLDSKLPSSHHLLIIDLRTDTVLTSVTLASKRPRTIIRSLDQLASRNGVPASVISDQSAHWVNCDVGSWATLRGVSWVYAPIGHLHLISRKIS